MVCGDLGRDKHQIVVVPEDMSQFRTKQRRSNQYPFVSMYCTMFTGRKRPSASFAMRKVQSDLAAAIGVHVALQLPKT